MVSLTEYYCSQCREPLTKTDAVDERHAWCQGCGAVVSIAHLRRPWLWGMLVVVTECILIGLT